MPKHNIRTAINAIAFFKKIPPYICFVNIILYFYFGSVNTNNTKKTNRQYADLFFINNNI